MQETPVKSLGQEDFLEKEMATHCSILAWEICIQVKKQQLELDIEPQNGSKSGKEYLKTVYCHPAYLSYMQSEWSRSVVSDSLRPHGL